MSAEVEIEAPPETVRSVFMDFARYEEWCSWRVEPVDTHKRPYDLKLDDKLNVDLKGAKFSPLVKENSEECFAWLGSLPYIFTGKHEFWWKPSSKTPGGTTMIQLENFTGLLAFTFGPGWSWRESALKNWNAFFADLKTEVEKRAT